MQISRFIPTLTAAATLMIAGCKCSDTPLPKEVEDRVEDVRGGVSSTVTLMPTGEWLANARLDWHIRKFILDETYDRATNPDVGKGKKQKKRVESLIEEYRKELGLDSLSAEVKEIDILDRTRELIGNNRVDKALFSRVFEDSSLAREWMNFCYLQSKVIYEDRKNGRIEIDDFKFVAITMTLFDIASRQLHGFSTEDFQRLSDTIKWYEKMKSQALTNVTRIKEAKELEKKNLYSPAAAIYREVGVTSDGAIDYAIAIVDVAKKIEPKLTEYKAGLDAGIPE